MSVDILPSEIPKDSSIHFSDKFLPFLRTLIRKEKQERLSEEDKVNLGVLERGTIVEKGKLTAKHQWLEAQLNDLNSGAEIGMRERKKRVLMLGSGMVAKPAVDHICTRSDIELVVGTLYSLIYRNSAHSASASNNPTEAAALVLDKQNASSVSLDIKDQDYLQSLIQKSDVVIRCETHQCYCITE